MKVIQGKLKGRQPKLKEREMAQSADVVDLMARLRASLESKSGTRPKARTALKKTSKPGGRKPKHAA